MTHHKTNKTQHSANITVKLCLTAICITAFLITNAQQQSNKQLTLAPAVPIKQTEQASSPQAVTLMTNTHRQNNIALLLSPNVPIKQAEQSPAGSTATTNTNKPTSGVKLSSDDNVNSNKTSTQVQAPKTTLTPEAMQQLNMSLNNTGSNATPAAISPAVVNPSNKNETGKPKQ
ncbi:hypothetical protein ACI6Q2_06455 [Chitinophagaceae bacterium LWZ2-11]